MDGRDYPECSNPTAVALRGDRVAIGCSPGGVMHMSGGGFATIVASEETCPGPTRLALHAHSDAVLVICANALESRPALADQSAECAATVQRCLNILAQDMLRFELDHANLLRFINSQTAAAQASPATAPHSASVVPLPSVSPSTSPASSDSFSKRARPPPLPFAPNASPAASPLAARADPPPMPTAAATTRPDGAVEAQANGHSTTASHAGRTAGAQFAYDGGDDSMSLTAGGRLLPLEADESEEWWLGRNIESQEEGHFPAKFVKIVQ